MNTKNLAAKVFSSAVLLTVPVMAFADINTPVTPGNDLAAGTTGIMGIINAVLNLVWPIFIGFAVIMFIYAGFLFLSSRGSEEQVATARQAVLWGAVGVVVGVIAFSLPYILQSTITG